MKPEKVRIINALYLDKELADRVRADAKNQVRNLTDMIRWIVIDHYRRADAEEDTK